MPKGYLKQRRASRPLSWRQHQRKFPTVHPQGPTIRPELAPTIYILPGNRVIFFTGKRRAK